MPGPCAHPAPVGLSVKVNTYLDISPYFCPFIYQLPKAPLRLMMEIVYEHEHSKGFLTALEV